jgi:hypothetical protein
MSAAAVARPLAVVLLIEGHEAGRADRVPLPDENLRECKRLVARRHVPEFQPPIDALPAELQRLGQLVDAAEYGDRFLDRVARDDVPLEHVALVLDAPVGGQ